MFCIRGSNVATHRSATYLSRHRLNFAELTGSGATPTPSLFPSAFVWRFPAPQKAVVHTPSTRMEIRTWRSAIVDLRTPPPGGSPGALELEEGNHGWVWRCDAAISRYKEKTCLFGRFLRAAKIVVKAQG